MKIYEIVLLMISGLGGKLGGKTKVQKLCYFYSALKGKRMGFKPHYYGPYSPAVENALDELEGIGLIDKQVENFGENSDGYAITRYDYEITKYGEQVVDATGDSIEKKELQEFVKKIGKIGLPDTMDISIAAKAYYILQREKRTLTFGEIRKKAGDFGWEINHASIDKAVNFLKELEVVKK
ncbi:MAG: hypothetical protein GY950_37020 [bacterium]|nr:hypothetical protein [bacterium]